MRPGDLSYDIFWADNIDLFSDFLIVRVVFYALSVGFDI